MSKLPRGADNRPDPRELAKQAFEKDANPAIEEALRELTPEEAALFVGLLEVAMKKRRLMLFGYLLALAVFFSGMLLALFVYGTREPGQVLEWVFLVPFTGVGAVLYLFGRWSKSIEQPTAESIHADIEARANAAPSSRS